MDNPEHLLAHTLPFWPELSAEEQDTLKRSLLSAAVPRARSPTGRTRSARACFCSCPASCGCIFSPKRAGRSPFTG